MSAPTRADYRALARTYHDHGINVLPVGENKKLVDVMKWERWQTEQQSPEVVGRLPFREAVGVAAVCGTVSAPDGACLACIDADKAPGEAVLLNLLGQMGLPSDYSWAVHTPGKGGGWHVWVYVCRLAEELAKKGLEGSGRLEAPFPGSDHIELRWDKAYTVLPGSSHPEGGIYSWQNGNGAPPNEPPATVEAGHVVRLGKWAGATEDGTHAPAPPLAEKIAEGAGRHPALASYAGSMRRRGAVAEAMLAALRIENRRVCAVPIPDADLIHIANSMMKYAPADPINKMVVVWKSKAGSEQLPAEGDPGKRSALYVCLGDVPARPVDYEWHRRLVRGSVNMLVGDPGMGKSFIELDIASRVTRGSEWPDNSGRATGGAVILLTAEDALAETVRPRVDRMGGDPSRIFVLEAVHTDNAGNKSFNLADDLPVLEEMVRETSAVMVEIDPLHAYLSAHVDSHRGSDVRGQIMSPLQALADRCHVTILLVHHLNKNADNLSALYRVSSSLDFVAAARSVMGVTFDPEDAEEDENLRRRILVTMKFNLDLLPPALGYHLTDGRVAWDAEPVRIDRRQMFRSGKAPRQPSELAERARAFVNQYLIDGEWHETTPLVEQAAKVGVDRNAVYDALHALEAESKRQGFPAIGCWRLAPRDEEDNPDGFPF